MLDRLTLPPLPILRGSVSSCEGTGSRMLMTGCAIPSTPRRRTATTPRGGGSGMAAAITLASTHTREHLTVRRQASRPGDAPLTWAGLIEWQTIKVQIVVRVGPRRRSRGLLAS